MIPFDCMKKIKDERPTIIEVKKNKGFTFEYSEYCLVKNKYGYLVARYTRCKEQKLEFWDDCPSTHPLNESDEWHLLTNHPVFSFHLQLIEGESCICVDQNGNPCDATKEEGRLIDLKRPNLQYVKLINRNLKRETVMNAEKGAINISLAKSNVKMCYFCGEVKERSEIKYIYKGLSRHWIPACQKCRDRYKNNKLLKYFVKTDK